MVSIIKMGSWATTDWMLNRLCPNLITANSIHSDHYSVYPNSSFERNPSISNNQFITFNNNIENNYGPNQEPNVYFQKQSTLVEESINAMDSIAINSSIHESSYDIECINKNDLLQSSLEDLYNKISCENLNGYTFNDNDFLIPLKLNTNNEVPTYPYQYDQIHFNSGTLEDIQPYSLKLLPLNTFFSDSLPQIKSFTDNIHQTTKITRSDSKEITESDLKEIQESNLEPAKESELDLDEEFDFDEIELDEKLDQTEGEQVGVEPEETDKLKIDEYLWGENTCTYPSLISVLQTSVSLDGLTEKIVIGQSKPIYSNIDFKELEDQRDLKAREIFLEYRKLINKYRKFNDLSKEQNEFKFPKNSLLNAVGQFYISQLTHNPTRRITDFLRTIIYDLNAPNTIYKPITQSGSSPDPPVIYHNPYMLRDLDGLAYLRPPICYGEDGYKEAGEDMGESYKRWKRRMQILDKETRLALVNMGKSLEDIESTYMQMENRKTTNSLLEFYHMKQIFSKLEPDKLCNHSFDDVYNSKYPYQGAIAETDLSIRPIMHCRIALNLTGTLPISGTSAKIALARFHRPDFRDGIFKAHLRYIRTGSDPTGVWNSWRSRKLFESTVLSRYRQGDYDCDLPLDMYTEDDKEENLTHHPANYFLNEFDLSLSDDCSFALLEYIEQFPFYLSNPGMASRVSRYIPNNQTEQTPNRTETPQKNEQVETPYKSSEDSTEHEIPEPQSFEVEGIKKMDIFTENIKLLGPLGTLHKKNEIDMFGVSRKINYGMALMENHLYRAPIYHHPLENVSDFNVDTDFLLIRRTYEENGERKTAIFLRKLVPIVRSDTCGDYDEGALYTVGQCEPKLEVPAPDSKVYYEDMKSLVRSWVNKRISEWPEGFSDYKRLRDEAKATFSPHVPDRDVIHIIKSVESQPKSEVIQQIKPETVCLLESARAALQRLQMIGISSLQTVDRLAAILSIIENEERECDEKDSKAREFCSKLRVEFLKRLEALGLNMNRESNLPTDFTVSLYGHVGSKKYFPLVRFVEEVLRLTPWNITRDCKLVLTNKGSAQFMLYGFADPSGGRGEAINLLKRQNRYAQSLQAGTVAGTLEDLRKLSMPELRKRLIKYGVSDQVISSLPRWDQVALVRQYRSGFVIAGEGVDDFKFRLAPGEYQSRINQILDRQALALSVGYSAPEPTIEAVEEDEKPVELDDLVDELARDLEAVPEVDLIANVDTEERELSILRQRQEARATTAEEKWKDAERLLPVPGIMWLRRDRASSTEEFGNERAVFIYGKENIEKILEWRKSRKNIGTVARKVRVEEDSSEIKRLCRVCGQPGHIASNVKCPFYRGGKVRVERNRKEPFAIEEGVELTSSMDVLSEMPILDSISGRGDDSEDDLSSIGRRKTPIVKNAKRKQKTDNSKWRY